MKTYIEMLSDTSFCQLFACLSFEKLEVGYMCSFEQALSDDISCWPCNFDPVNLDKAGHSWGGVLQTLLV